MVLAAAAAKTLDEIAAWRDTCPDITLRSTFIVGYPGETEAEFQRFVQVIARPACVSPIDHTQSMPQQHVEAYLSAHRSPQVSIW